MTFKYSVIDHELDIKHTVIYAHAMTPMSFIVNVPSGLIIDRLNLVPIHISSYPYVEKPEPEINEQMPCRFDENVWIQDH